MSPDKSQLETVTLSETSSAPLNENTLPSQSNLTGQVLDERYVIEKELGHGGVGIVYLARDGKLHDKRVVIKVLLDRSLDNSWVVQKFQQEKEALARVDHPGVVGILDSGELPDGQPYIVMQFVDGVTLRSQISSQRGEWQTTHAVGSAAANRLSRRRAQSRRAVVGHPDAAIRAVRSLLPLPLGGY